MAQRKPRHGDYYLLPYAGSQRDLLVQAVQEYQGWQWWVAYAAYPQRLKSCVLLSSCHRCSPSRAQRILGVAPAEAPSITVPRKLLVDAKKALSTATGSFARGVWCDLRDAIAGVTRPDDETFCTPPPMNSESVER